MAGVDISRLTQLNLFGVAGEVAITDRQVAIALPADDIDAEQTKLVLKLTGATPSSLPSASRAMISHNQ